MRPSLQLAVAVLVAVAFVFVLMAIAGIGRDAIADRSPGATRIILKDTIHPSTTVGRTP